MLWLAVVLVGFAEGYVLLPFGLAAFLSAVFLIAFVVFGRCAEVAELIVETLLSRFRRGNGGTVGRDSEDYALSPS